MPPIQMDSVIGRRTATTEDVLWVDDPRRRKWCYLLTGRLTEFVSLLRHIVPMGVVLSVDKTVMTQVVLSIDGLL